MSSTFTIEGETLTIPEIIERCPGVNPQTVRSRLRHGARTWAALQAKPYARAAALRNDEQVQPLREQHNHHQQGERQTVSIMQNNLPAAAAAQNAADVIAAVLRSYAKEAVSESRVRAIVAEEVSARPPRVIELRGDVHNRLESEHMHPMFEKVLRLCNAGVNVLLTGPAGAGKTHLAAQVARALGREFGAISLTAGASESQLLGRLLPTGEGGRFEYHESPFVRLYENGGVFLFDEIDAADPNMLLVVNTALANGGFHCEMRTGNEYVKRNENSVLIGAANTFGTGADSMYTGRAQLDAASLDRWYVVEVDYDNSFERSLIGMPQKQQQKQWEAAPEPTDDELRELGGWIFNVRDKAKTKKLRRIVSTRAIQKAMIARRAGIPTAEIKRDLLAGWSKDELEKVGVQL